VILNRVVPVQLARLNATLDPQRIPEADLAPRRLESHQIPWRDQDIGHANWHGMTQSTPSLPSYMFSSPPPSLFVVWCSGSLPSFTLFDVVDAASFFICHETEREQDKEKQEEQKA
jgi:hypothetical protein